MHTNFQNDLLKIDESDYKLDLSHGTKIMGIVNVTPDSFYDGGKYSTSIEATVNHAMKMVEEGVDILDVGAESSRPGANPISESEEIDRIIPVIEGIRKKRDILISVDTYKSKVATYALESGANWINDISGLTFDETMSDVVSKFNCPVVVMHMQGNPKSMQIDPVYEDVVSELIEFFLKRIDSLNQANIKNIIIDPGIGFGKTQSHNIEILSKIERFLELGYPVLVGASRKSFIGNIIDSNVDERLAGSLAVLSWLAMKKVNIIRVHDVRESVETIKILNSITETKINQF